MSEFEDILPELQKILATGERSNESDSLEVIETEKLQQLRELFTKTNIAASSKVYFGNTKFKFAENENYLNLTNPEELSDYIELVTIGQKGVTDDIEALVAENLKLLPKIDFKYPSPNSDYQKKALDWEDLKDLISDFGEFDSEKIDTKTGLSRGMLTNLQTLTDRLEDQNFDMPKLADTKNMIAEVTTIYQYDGSAKSHFSYAQIEYMARIISGEQRFPEAQKDDNAEQKSPTDLQLPISIQKGK